METMNFKLDVHATPEKVWSTLWNDATYRQWTAPFMEGSHAVTDDWKEGTKVLFLGPGASGMVSTITENKPFKRMAFTHLGEVKNGEEDYTSDSAKQWSGATETYTLTGNGTDTKLEIEMTGNISKEFLDYFSMAWPKALDKLKELAEM